MKREKNKEKINPYESYIYSYPHKKSYREFEKSVNLKKLWRHSARKNISLYIHIPFCSNKCGYCNLLSTTCFSNKRLEVYVEKLIQEVEKYKEILNIKETDEIFTSVILGGGTPTILSINLMRKLLESVKHHLNVDFSKVFFSIETSPKTLSKEYLEFLKEYNIKRVSIGIQSFKNIELLKIYRNELSKDIEEAMKVIFNPLEKNVEIRNLDLIYGLPDQTLKTWEESLKRVIDYNPEEIFIYPLYVREKTKLYENYKRDHKLMEQMYDYGVKILNENGYVQTSMRNFINKNMEKELYPDYSCQENEMLGIGCGARSYIENIHYSRKYAVEDKNINKIIDSYLKENNFETAEYGYILSLEEEKIKYILKSILKVTGLDIKEYTNKFNTDPVVEFPELQKLTDEEFLILKNKRIFPSDKGLKYSDYIGTLFISEEINKKINEFAE